MRRTAAVVVLLVALAVRASAQQDPRAKFVGTWSGTVTANGQSCTGGAPMHWSRAETVRIEPGTTTRSVRVTALVDLTGVQCDLALVSGGPSASGRCHADGFPRLDVRVQTDAPDRLTLHVDAQRGQRDDTGQRVTCPLTFDGTLSRSH